MATAAKSRRPQPAVIMSTPPQQSRTKSAYTDTEKQGLLQNFDLEVADKTQYFRSILARTLASFNMREESEILSIPRELRKMTLGELENKWGGGWAGTLQRIRRESFEKREKVREKEEEEKVGEVKGKRKRNTTAMSESSPVRPTKNTRRETATPAGTRKAKAATASSSITRGKPPSSVKRGKPVASSSTSKPPSSLPQNHVFNPSLPPTPFRSTHSSRPATSPLSRPSSRPPPSSRRSADEDESAHERDQDDDSSSASGSGSGSGSDDDLPDPAVLEARLLSKANRARSPNSKSKKKRGPSLIFRQSLLPNQLATAATAANTSANADDGPSSTISLSDGRTISFNPLNLTPGRVDRELDEGGVSKEEKARVSKQVHEEVYKVLSAQMEKWKM